MVEELLWWAKQSDFEYDYMMWSLFDEVPKPLYTFKEIQQQYNQRKADPYWCCRYAVMTCIANNWGIDRTDADFLYMRETAPKYGRVDKEGMYLSKAGDMVIDYLNKKYPWQGRKKQSINIVNEWETYMNMWYMLHMGSKINKKYTSDIQDWLISSVWWFDWIGHSRSTSIIQTWKSLVENYVGWLPHNVIDLWSWDEIMKYKQFYTQAFIYYPTQKMPEAIPYPYMTIQEAELLEKKYPDLFTPDFSESVRAWIDLATEGKIKYWYTKYKGIDGVTKMMIDIDNYRQK